MHYLGYLQQLLWIKWEKQHLNLLFVTLLTLWGHAIVLGESSSFIFRGFILLHKNIQCLKCSTHCEIKVIIVIEEE